MKTLVVEDVQMLCREIVSVFHNHPISTNVLSTHSGSHALEVIRVQKPDVILLDIELPDISGLRIARHALTNTPDVIVVLMSAFFDQTTVFSVCELKGLSGFISKAEVSIPEIPGIVYSVRPSKPYFSAGFTEALRKHTADVQNIRKVLSKEERRLLGLIGAGLNEDTIANTTGIPEPTIKWRTKQLRQKLNAHKRTDLVTISQKLGAFRSTWFDLNLIDKYDLN